MVTGISEVHGWINWRWVAIFGLIVALALALATLPLRLLLPAVAATAGGLLLLRWPWLVWPLIGVALPVSSGVRVGPLTGTEGLLAGAVALWLVDGVRRRSLRLAWRPRLVLVSLAVYLAAQGLSLLRAPDLGEGVAEMVKWAEFALVLLIVPQMVKREQARWLVAGLLLGGVFQALLGLYQFVFQIGPPWFLILGRFMRASGTFAQPNPYAGYLGLTLPVAASLGLWALGALQSRRESMSAGRPTSPPQRWFTGNEPGEAPFPRRRGGLGQRSRGARPHSQAPSPLEGKGLRLSRHQRGSGEGMGFPLDLLFYTGATAAIGVALLASWSRGGWLGALAGVGLVVALRTRATVTLAVVGVALLLAASGPLAAVVPAPVAERFADLPEFVGVSSDPVVQQIGIFRQPVTDANFAVLERLAHWEAARRMWVQSPWLGIGTGNYAVVYPEVNIRRWEEPLGHAHNIYLNTLAETGLIGLLAFLGFWLSVALFIARRTFGRSSDTAWHEAAIGNKHYAVRNTTWNRALALGVLGVLAHLAVHNVFDNLFVQGMYLHIALWIAAVLVAEEAVLLQTSSLATRAPR